MNTVILSIQNNIHGAGYIYLFLYKLFYGIFWAMIVSKLFGGNRSNKIRGLACGFMFVCFVNIHEFFMPYLGVREKTILNLAYCFLYFMILILIGLCNREETFLTSCVNFTAVVYMLQIFTLVFYYLGYLFCFDQNTNYYDNRLISLFYWIYSYLTMLILYIGTTHFIKNRIYEKIPYALRFGCFFLQVDALILMIAASFTDNPVFADYDKQKINKETFFMFILFLVLPVLSGMCMDLSMRISNNRKLMKSLSDDMKVTTEKYQPYADLYKEFRRIRHDFANYAQTIELLQDEDSKSERKRLKKEIILKIDCLDDHLDYIISDHEKKQVEGEA